MNKLDIKLLVLDIDGTILPSQVKTLSEPLKKGLQQAMKNGVKILIATGRHYKFIQQSLINDLTPDYLVTINGGCLIDNQGNILESYPIPKETVERLIKVCEEKGIALAFKCSKNIAVYTYFDKYVEGYVGKESPLARLLIDNTATKDYHKTTDTPLGMFLIEKNEVIYEIKDLFPELTFAASHRNGVDAFMNNVNKATTVESFLNKQGLSWDNVMSFGDAENDTEMILRAKIGVAMGNAVESLKQNADYVTDRVEEDGVLTALKHFEII